MESPCRRVFPPPSSHRGETEYLDPPTITHKGKQQQVSRRLASKAAAPSSVAGTFSVLLCCDHCPSSCFSFHTVQYLLESYVIVPCSTTKYLNKLPFSQHLLGHSVKLLPSCTSRPPSASIPNPGFDICLSSIVSPPPFFPSLIPPFSSTHIFHHALDYANSVRPPLATSNPRLRWEFFAPPGKLLYLSLELEVLPSEAFPVMSSTRQQQFNMSTHFQSM